MAELVFYRHGEELLRVALGQRTTIGRAPECDVSLPDPALSRVQAEVLLEPNGYVLRDRSGRGTRVGAADVSEADLEDGGEIALGGWRALFRRGAPADENATQASGETRIAPRNDGELPRAARISVRSGARDRSMTLPSTGLTVGSGTQNDVVLEDAFVSARHLRIESRAGRWFVRDLGSTNGTFMHGARVEHAELVPGISVRLGNSELQLESADHAGRVPSAAFENMVSSDPAMRQMFELIERVAPSDAAVMILGETGSGKELVARAIHARSQRSQGPFIPVNCSAIAESLIESELFGHEKGAFSGADRLRKGAFEEADGGTIFLDEVGELPLDLQPKLLRALELGEIKRVGSSRPMQVSARIVAATHRDLRAQVRGGKFREDLYYRLCVVPVLVPPLRQRRTDIRALVEHILSLSAPRGLRLRFAEDAMRKLEDYDWPGNVRQLKNVIQRALLFRGEGLVIDASAVVFDDTRASPGDTGDNDTLYIRGLSMEDIEREAIRLSLRRHRGKRAAVIKELGLAKSTVMKRIGQWNLQDEGREGTTPEPDETEEEAATA